MKEYEITLTEQEEERVKQIIAKRGKGETFNELCRNLIVERHAELIGNKKGDVKNGRK